MIVIDDFIKDQSLLDRVAQDETFFSQNGQYMWWYGWWNSPATSLKKELIQYIWGEHSPHTPIGCVGFEYWTGIYSQEDEKDELRMHFDKDEYLWDTEGELVTPIIGTVFYPMEQDIDGGYLEIFSKGQDNEPERIEAKYNRLVIFPAGEYPHRVTKVTRGTRYAIAINLWDVEPTAVKNNEMILEN